MIAIVVTEAQVLAAIDRGAGKFGEICKAVDINPHAQEMREVDYLLQKLRRLGKIKRTGKPARWVIAKRGR